MCVRARARVCVCVCALARVLAHVRACMRVYVCVRARARVCVCGCVCVNSVPINKARDVSWRRLLS